MSIKGKGKSGGRVSVLKRRGYLSDGTFRKRGLSSVLYIEASHRLLERAVFFHPFTWRGASNVQVPHGGKRNKKASSNMMHKFKSTKKKKGDKK